MCIIRSLIVLFALLVPGLARANDVCEPAGTDCRAVLLSYINRETVRIDVGMEEMTDSILADALIAKHRAKVPVRLLVEPRRNKSEPRNAPILDKLKAAGIPMRYKPAGGILHWKMMIFAGQYTVEFSAAQFSPHYLVPVEPFVNFTQDPIVFVTDTKLVNSFQRKFDDAWVDTANFANYANAATPTRAYPLYAVSPSMNFVPGENFLTRVKPLYDAETAGIDVIIYKVTEAGHADAMIRAAKRGVPVRVIVEPVRYRARDNVWQAYHIDRMHVAGVAIRNRKHAGFTHQKTALLVGQGRTIFGSSNWTAASNTSQYEHNYLATDAQFFGWFRDIFLRKWRSTTETTPFVPLPPDTPVYVTPANLASGQPTTVVLSWKPGPWAHRADVYLGTSNPPVKIKTALSVSPNTTKKLTVSVQPGKAYYWQIVSKTMAGKEKKGPVWSFGT
jgi:phosphatidylserine/phosphatidylglycerophosphate/cardiolipin synthase-like enzyme